MLWNKQTTIKSINQSTNHEQTIYNTLTLLHISQNWSFCLLYGLEREGKKVNQSINQPTNQLINHFMNEYMNISINDLTDQHTNTIPSCSITISWSNNESENIHTLYICQWTHLSIHPSIDRSINHYISQSINQSIHPSTNHLPPPPISRHDSNTIAYLRIRSNWPWRPLTCKKTIIYSFKKQSFTHSKNNHSFIPTNYQSSDLGLSSQTKSSSLYSMLIHRASILSITLQPI